MSNHRASYKKTTVFAVGGGTLNLVASVLVLYNKSVGIPGTELNFVIHPFLAWSGGMTLLGLALVCYAVAFGGWLALRYDARGRAVF